MTNTTTTIIIIKARTRGRGTTTTTKNKINKNKSNDSKGHSHGGFWKGEEQKEETNLRESLDTHRACFMGDVCHCHHKGGGGGAGGLARKGAKKPSSFRSAAGTPVGRKHQMRPRGTVPTKKDPNQNNFLSPINIASSPAAVLWHLRGNVSVGKLYSDAPHVSVWWGTLSPHSVTVFFRFFSLLAALWTIIYTVIRHSVLFVLLWKKNIFYSVSVLFCFLHFT